MSTLGLVLIGQRSASDLLARTQSVVKSLIYLGRGALEFGYVRIDPDDLTHFGDAFLLQGPEIRRLSVRPSRQGAAEKIFAGSARTSIRGLALR